MSFVGDNHHLGHPPPLTVSQETPDFGDFSLAGLGPPVPLSWEVTAQTHVLHRHLKGRTAQALWLLLSDVSTFVIPLVPLNARNGRVT